MPRSYRAQLTRTWRCIHPSQHALGELTPVSYNGSAIISHRQAFTTTRPVMATLSASLPSGELIKVNFSENQPEDLSRRAEALLSSWQITPSGKGLKKEFLFKTFNNAWKFMDTVAQECKVKRHHPEWSNLYNRVTIEWTTHRPEGLSIKDAEMAEFCDQKAFEIGLKGSESNAAAGTSSVTKPAP